MSINANFSDVSNFLWLVLVSVTSHPILSLIVLFTLVLSVVVIAINVADLYRKFIKPSVEDEEGGKRRKTKKKPYGQIAFRIIIIAVVLWIALMILGKIGSVILGKEETNPEVSVTDGSSSSSEETEESSSESVKESRYVVVQDDISWSDAKKACENDGGHLATITSREEYKQVVAELESYIQENDSSAENILYVWLGGWNEDSDSKRGVNNYEWITGEKWDHNEIDFFWCNTTSDDGTIISEPSFTDENTGTIENRLVLWKHEMSGVLWEQEKVTLTWTFSDQNGDILNLPEVSSFVQGHIAYICEYDDYSVDTYD
ncbi:MAG: hypothetical protein LUG17_04170 [Clostridiales bacterium]|nr:hypothetical protein [Clostridiales bacterium]